jgi:hypothetical protein
MPVIKAPAITTTNTPVATTTARRPAILQADLLDRFAHLRRQREAGRLAERILRIVSSVEQETGEMALEIAATAVRMNQPEANGALPDNGRTIDE